MNNNTNNTIGQHEITKFFEVNDNYVYRVFANRYGFRVIIRDFNNVHYTTAACVSNRVDDPYRNQQLGRDMVHYLVETNRMMAEADTIVSWVQSSCAF